MQNTQLPNLGFSPDTLTLGNLFRVSWDVFSKNFREILIIVLIVYIPVDLLSYIISIAPGISIKDYLKYTSYVENLIGIIATLSIAIFLSQKLIDSPIGVKESLKRGLSMWGKVVGANIVTNIMIGFLTLLFIVPGIIYGTYWTFITFIILFFGVSGDKAREHSKNLVIGYWWKTFFMIFVTFIINMMITFGFTFVWYFILGMIGIITTTESGSNLIGFVSDFFNSISIDVLSSYFTVFSYIMYIAYETTRNIAMNNEPLLSNKINTITQ